MHISVIKALIDRFVMNDSRKDRDANLSWPRAISLNNVIWIFFFSFLPPWRAEHKLMDFMSKGHGLFRV